MIDELRAKSLAGANFRRWYGEGKKAEIWVCGNIKNLSSSRETKCEECGEKMFFDSGNEEFMDKETKKLCIKCVLKNYKEELNEEQIKILEKVNE